MPLRILELLVAAQGKTVTRAELKRTLWPYAVRIDTDKRLNTAVRALREALDESADRPQYIQTIRGHGYRWIGAEPLSRASPRRWPWGLGLSCLLALSVMVGLGRLASQRETDLPSPSAQARFVQLAALAETDLAGAQAGLDALVGRFPDYGPARLLRARLAMSDWRQEPTPVRLARVQAIVESERAVEQSSELDTYSAELALVGDWNWKAAERLYLRAIAADPNNSDAHQGLAWLYVNTGRPAAALEKLGPVLTNNQLTPEMRADIGWLLLRAGRPDLAASMCHSQNTRHLNLLSCHHTALAHFGRFEEARAIAVEIAKIVGVEPSIVAGIRDVPARRGYEAFLAWRVSGFFPQQGHWFQRAQLEAEAGRLDQALASLERAVAVRDPQVMKIASTSAFEKIAQRPRFRRLLIEVGVNGGRATGSGASA